MFVFTTYNNEKFKTWRITNIEKNIIKDVRNLFRSKKLKKETKDAEIKGLRNLFRLKKKLKQLKTEQLEILGIFSSMKIIINQ